MMYNLLLTEEKARECLRLSKESYQSLFSLAPLERESLLAKQMTKMLRRYPPEFFPEKALLIRRSFLRLINSREYWQDFFTANFSFAQDNSEHQREKRLSCPPPIIS